MKTKSEKEHSARLPLTARATDQVMPCRPTNSPHKNIVRSAAYEAALEHRDLFIALAKI